MAYRPEWRAVAPADRRFGRDSVGCVSVCFLDRTPLSPLMTQNTKHSDPIATAKAPDTTYRKSMHLADELQLFMWHICVSEACDSSEVPVRREVLIRMWVCCFITALVMLPHQSLFHCFVCGKMKNLPCGSFNQCWVRPHSLYCLWAEWSFCYAISKSYFSRVFIIWYVFLWKSHKKTQRISLSDGCVRTCSTRSRVVIGQLLRLAPIRDALVISVWQETGHATAACGHI